MNILIIAPHADDEILGCGGIMARYIAEGHTVKVLIMTKAIEELFPQSLVEQARNEAKASHAFLGVSETVFFDFPAPVLDQTASYKMSIEISKLISEFQPEKVYLPHRGDIHKDHKMVFEAALVAMRPINNCPVKEIYAYETLSETEWAAPFGDDAFIPNVFVNIADYLNVKQEAMKHFASQLKEFPHSRSLETIEALAKYRGATVGKKAAEAFMLIRKII